MKRMLCLLLVLCELCFCFPYRSYAVGGNDHQALVVPVVVDKGGTASEWMLSVVSQNGEFYIKPQDFCQITRYRHSATDNQIVFSLGSKYLQINTADQSLKVNNAKQHFSGCIQINGTAYLPMSELLPWMNVQCYIADSKLHIDSDALSYWEVISDFSPTDYLFDLADTYGGSTGDIIGLCAISVFDCILDLGNIWKKVVPIDSGETSIYEYEIYKECFREFAVADVGTQAEVQSLLSSMSGMVSDSSQFLNAYYTPLFTEETRSKVESVLGVDFAEGLDEWPIEAVQITDTLKYAKTALKYMKTGYLYTRIATEHTSDYAQALRYIYLEDSTHPDGVELAASEAVVTLESKAGTIANTATTILSELGDKYLSASRDELVGSVVEKYAADTIFGSLGLYLDIVDASLSLVWPVNDAYAEITKMTVYQSIQYDALNAFFSNPEKSQQDISNGRTSAIIFLKTARKCYQAQQGTFDLYGGEGVLDWKIAAINKKILEFELSSISEENDAINNKQDYSSKLKKYWSDLMPPPSDDNREDIDLTVGSLVGNWNCFQNTEGTHMTVSYLTLNADGTASSLCGSYATDFSIYFEGTWTASKHGSNRFVIQLNGQAGYYELGVGPVLEPYCAQLDVVIQGEKIFISAIDPDATCYWVDQSWHERNLDFETWIERDCRGTALYEIYGRE